MLAQNDIHEKLKSTSAEFKNNEARFAEKFSESTNFSTELKISNENDVKELKKD